MKLLERAIRYFIIGATATGLYLGLLYFFADIAGIHYLVANTIAFIISTVVGFFGHKYLTFKNFNDNIMKQFISFSVAGFIGLIINLSAVFVVVEILNQWHMAGAVLGAAMVYLWNFTINNSHTFKPFPIND